MRATLAALACAALLVASAREARADSVGLSVSIERAAGVAFSNLHPNGTDSLSLTTVTLAGAAVNPIALPRLGVDVILPSGLTLGTGIAAGYATLADNPSGGGQGTSINGSAWLVSPRVGYRFRLGSLIDLTPRGGVTFAGGSEGGQSSESCFYSGSAGTPTCSTSTYSTSVFFTAVSLELAMALRVTSSFNLLAGLSFDDVFAASGSSSTSGQGSNASQNVNAGGSYVGGQLWLGLGGYIL